MSHQKRVVSTLIFISITLLVTVSCGDALDCDTPPKGVFGEIWHGDPALQARLGCPMPMHPETRGSVLSADFQPFERGAMVSVIELGWLVPDQGQSLCSKIYIFYDEGSFQRIFDGWDEEPFSGDDVPPDGLFEPAPAFREAWRKEPGVRDALGWTTAEEAPTQGYQTFQHGVMIWIGQRQGVYVLTLEGTYTIVDASHDD